MRSITSPGTSEVAGAAVHFGGPDRPARLLRDLLRRRIDAVPSGGEIVWATYYFRDRDLAAALIEAADRGVRVILQVEGAPRRKGANDAVLDMFAGDRLRGGLHIHAPILKRVHPHLHSKIYCFSHPSPMVLVGSFNPSGDDPEDPDVIAEIGDQDRGHNVLVELTDPALVAPIRRHAARLHLPFARLRNGRKIEGGGISAWFLPRLRPTIVERTIPGARQVRGCISHLKPGLLTRRLVEAARQGSDVRLLVHDTSRRVPEAALSALRAAGSDVRRFIDPEGLPLHAKFLIVDDVAWFGSYNFNPRSRWLNREILLASTDPQINRALADRFEDIWTSLAR